MDEANAEINYINLILDVKPTSSDTNTKTYETSIETIDQDTDVILPIDEEILTKARNLNKESAIETAYDETKLYAQLKLNHDLVVKGTLELAAMISSITQPKQGHISGHYTQLDLNGHKLTIENGGLVACNGKIIDSSQDQQGKIEVNNGGTIISDFIVDDFYGGSNCATKYLGKITPFNKYRMSYIEPETIVHYGAKYQGYCVLYASNDHNETIQNIVGEGGLFELENEDSYIVKKTDGKSRNETISIYGNTHSNVMSINVLAINVATAGILFPLPRHYTINICRGTFTLNTMLKILPGAEVNVEKDATIKMNGAQYGTSTFSSQVIVYDEFWDYTKNEDVTQHFRCKGHATHKYPYYDADVDSTLVDGGHDQPGKLTINGSIEFGNVKGIAIAGDIHTSKDNIENLKTSFEENKERISFHIDSNELYNQTIDGITVDLNTGNITGGGNILCFTMSKTKLNIIVDDSVEDNVTFAKLETLTIYREDEEEIHVGDTINLQLKVYPLDYVLGASDVTWKSSSPEIANIKSSDNQHAEIECLAIGKTIITATVGNIVSNQFEITVLKNANFAVYDWTSEFKDGILQKEDYTKTVNGDTTIIGNWEKTLTGNVDQEITGGTFVGKKEKDESKIAPGFVFFGDIGDKLLGFMAIMTTHSLKKVTFKVIPLKTATKVKFNFRFAGTNPKNISVNQDKGESNWDGTLASAIDITVEHPENNGTMCRLNVPYEEGNEFAIVGMTLSW